MALKLNTNFVGELVSDKDLELAKDFLSFQEKTIDIFKEYL